MEDTGLDGLGGQSEKAPDSPEEQKKEILEVIEIEGPMTAGDLYYIISLKWFNQWRDWVGMARPPLMNDSKEEPSRPGPIDNSEILDEDEDNELDPSMTEGRDFDFISKSVWEVLHAWYGGGPALPRKVLNIGNELKVEVHRLKLIFVTDSDDDTDDGTVAYFSKGDSVNSMHRAVCEQLDRSFEDVRLWDFYQDYRQKILNEPEISLEDAQLLDEQKILVEAKKDGKFAEVAARSISAPVITYPSTSYSGGGSSYGQSSNYSTGWNSGYSSYYSSYNYSSRSYNYPPADKPGLVGLSNLGNTCFMNSAIQCLSNSVPLANAFLRDDYIADLNTDNPLGTGGLLAKEWATLMKDIWGGRSSVIAPREFKWRLGKFAPQFEGYQQHDSQELLSFLLDGIHEDLNRIKKKPSVETTDSADRPDEEVAREHWESYRARNDSLIVDWFQGQFKSRLICPTCERISVTFDPFMYMSLPIPTPKYKMMPVVVLFLDPKARPTKCTFKMNKQGTCAELYAECGKYFNLPPYFASADVFASKFYKRFSQDWGIVENFQPGRDSIWLYQIAPPASADEPQVQNFAVYSRKVDGHSSYGVRSSLFGTPFWQPVSVGVTPEALYAQLVTRLERFIAPAFPEAEAVVDSLASSRDSSIASSADSLASSKDSLALQSSSGLDFVAGDRVVAPATTPDEVEVPLHSSADSEADSEQAEPEETASVEFRGELFNILFCDGFGNPVHPQPFLEVGKPIVFPKRDKDVTILLDWTRAGLDRYRQMEEREYVTDPSASAQDEPEEAVCSLDKCINLFTEAETLGEDDAWYCNRCKEHKLADKKMDLWSLPKILCIHLKRFSYKGKYMFREKLDTVVQAPLKGLDMRPYLLKPDDGAIYDLYAVSNHYGALGGGHYTAAATNKVTGQWYKFDDSSVAPISEDNVITSAAYVLFYRRRDSVQPDGLDSPQFLPAEPEATPAAAANNNQAASSSESSEDEEENAVLNHQSSAAGRITRTVYASARVPSSDSDEDADSYSG